MGKSIIFQRKEKKKTFQHIYKPLKMQKTTTSNKTTTKHHHQQQQQQQEQKRILHYFHIDLYAVVKDFFMC